MKADNINWTNVLLTAVIGLLSLLYHEHKSNEKDLIAILEKQQEKIQSIDVRLSIVEAQIFSIGEKKNRLTRNFKQYLFVNDCPRKRKLVREDDGDSGENCA